MTFVVDSNGVAAVQPNKQVLREWAEALESGDYSQTDGALSRDGGHCCLGVLCELAAKADVIPSAVQVIERDWDTGEETPSPHYSYLGLESFPPDAVAVWAFGDEETRDPELMFDGDLHPASALNDTLNLSFAEIAKAIRETYDV